MTAEFSATIQEMILICWFCAQETFLIINLENRYAANNFL